MVSWQPQFCIFSYFFHLCYLNHFSLIQSFESGLVSIPTPWVRIWEIYSRAKDSSFLTKCEESSMLQSIQILLKHHKSCSPATEMKLLTLLPATELLPIYFTQSNKKRRVFSKNEGFEQSNLTRQVVPLDTITTWYFKAKLSCLPWLRSYTYRVSY